MEPEKPRGKIGKGLIGMLFGKFEQDAPTGEPTRPGEAVKQDRRKTVFFAPQDAPPFPPQAQGVVTSGSVSLEKRITQAPPYTP